MEYKNVQAVEDMKKSNTSFDPFKLSSSNNLIEMEKPRVLIVGATGRTGSVIVDGLLEAGETVSPSFFLIILNEFTNNTCHSKSKH